MRTTGGRWSLEREREGESQSGGVSVVARLATRECMLQAVAEARFFVPSEVVWAMARILSTPRWQRRWRSSDAWAAERRATCVVVPTRWMGFHWCPREFSDLQREDGHWDPTSVDVWQRLETCGGVESYPRYHVLRREG